MIIFICSLIILSFLFNLISKFLRIPSVLLLLLTGIMIRLLSSSYKALEFNMPFELLKILGTLGLILIVLEGALDLKIEKSTKSTMTKSSVVSFLCIFFNSVILGFFISLYYHSSFQKGLINTLPISIISSAIIIPSIKHLSPNKRNFLTYESIFSDIIGILVFTMLITSGANFLLILVRFSINILITLIFSLILTIILFRILNFGKGSNEMIFTLSALVLFYTIGNNSDLPTLLMVVFLGIIFNNLEVLKNLLNLNIEIASFSLALSRFKFLIEETSFLIRTLFFFAFGYYLNFKSLFNFKILGLSLILVFLILLIRFSILNLLRTDNLSETLLAPRGLVSILLFYNIPQQYLIHNFDITFLFFVILITCLLMAGDLIFRKVN